MTEFDPTTFFRCQNCSETFSSIFSLCQKLFRCQNCNSFRQIILNSEDLDIRNVEKQYCKNIVSSFLFPKYGSNIAKDVSYDIWNVFLFQGLNQLVTNELVKAIALSAPKLTYFDIKSCTKVTDDSVCLLATKCTSINYLVLSGINSLTDKVIFCIANQLQFNLKEIYLCGCSKISRTSLRYLTDCCVNRLICQHNCPNYNPNEIYAKNLDTGDFERF